MPMSVVIFGSQDLGQVKKGKKGKILMLKVMYAGHKIK